MRRIGPITIIFIEWALAIFTGIIALTMLCLSLQEEDILRGEFGVMMAGLTGIVFLIFTALTILLTIGFKWNSAIHMMIWVIIWSVHVVLYFIVIILSLLLTSSSVEYLPAAPFGGIIPIFLCIYRLIIIIIVKNYYQSIAKGNRENSLLSL